MDHDTNRTREKRGRSKTGVIYGGRGTGRAQTFQKCISIKIEILIAVLIVEQENGIEPGSQGGKLMYHLPLAGWNCGKIYGLVEVQTVKGLCLVENGNQHLTLIIAQPLNCQGDPICKGAKW